MSVKIKLKNREKTYAIVDQKVFDEIEGNEYLMSVNFLKNLRAHSEGYPFFQRCFTIKKKTTYETIYLHKYIAEKFIPKPVSDKKLFITFMDKNVLNVTIENLKWLTMSELRRHMRSSKNKTGYRGVSFEKGRYRAIIYKDRKGISIGSFRTAEEAAKAYNEKSIELFGITNSLNDV